MNKRLVVTGIALFSAIAMASMDAIKERKHGFESFKEEMGAIKKIVQTGDASMQADLNRHVENLSTAANKQWQRFDELFPAGSHSGDTDALPSIWEKPDDFKAAITKQSEALALLKTAAQSNNPGEWKVAFGKVGSSCKGCHDSFKKD